MSPKNFRDNLINLAIHRPERVVDLPKNDMGRNLAISDYFGENVFDISTSEAIPGEIKREIVELANSNMQLSKKHMETIANAVTDWARSKGATHFCHWFQPLTGATAEKHDSFLSFSENNWPIEKLHASQLMKGEPDASSFPNGGSRSTFEARGYTTWDISSPMFIRKEANGSTLCIPTAFVSYHGDALDIKTPLLRSISKLNHAATKFLQLAGSPESRSVNVTCGAEQEYFLIDKAYYYSRPDLVMTGKTLFGQLTAKNQQLEDHYFGTIPSRVLSFMQELDVELMKAGIPSKTRHNEVAPGQFEVAPIHNDANRASDQNQLMMALIKRIAQKHDFEALFHEKPFQGINGSGKHLNWSMADNNGLNLLSPGNAPHQQNRFLAMVSIIVEAVHRHAKLIRLSVAGHGNDHRLGANEAPPSIISVFVGETLNKIFNAILSNSDMTEEEILQLDLGTNKLVELLKDNTDRNRTSPFAFTGNRFEFRAVGSSQAIGLPLSILNAAVTDVLNESNEFLKHDIDSGCSIDEALLKLTHRWIASAQQVIFNGDGYSAEWREEAGRRGLPNLKTTADAMEALADEHKTEFLSKLGIFRPNELKTRYNVLIERYIKHREIECASMITLIDQYVIPAVLDYKQQLLPMIKQQKDLGIESSCELAILNKLNSHLVPLGEGKHLLADEMKKLTGHNIKCATQIADEILPIVENLTKHCNELETVIPNAIWPLPKYFDMLFLS